MKTHLTILALVVSALATEGFCGERQTNSAPITFPEFVGKRTIDAAIRREANQKTNIADQVAYLTSIVANYQPNRLDAEASKAAALRLLGVAGISNSVALLVENLSFRENMTGTYPAMDGLILFGDVAVPQLLDLLERSPDKREWLLVVQALMRIKDKDYKRFVNDQKPKLPEEHWKKLVVYAIEP
jgi:hypothetical protein